MDLFRMQCFIQVARQLNMTRAAAAMHISQPAMTTQIQKLESEVGSQLLVRGSKRLEITPAGKEVLRGFDSILDIYKETLRRARMAEGAHECKRIRIGYHGGSKIMSSMLDDFKSEYPDIEVVIQIAEWDDITDAVETGNLDAAFTEASEISPYGHLSVIPLFTDRTLVVAMSPRHRYASLPSVTVEQLEGETIVMNGHRCTSMRKMYDGLLRCGLSTDQITLVEGLDAELVMAEMGRGMATCPRFFSSTKNTDLAYVPVSDGYVCAEMVLAWREDTAFDALQKLIDFNRNRDYSRIY